MQKRTIDSSPGNVVSPYEAHAGENNEVSLLDIWLVVRRRWLWLVAGALFGACVALGYLMLSVPIFESRASVQIGKVHDFGLIEDADVLEVQLIDQYGPESGERGQREMPHLKKAAKVPGQKNILRLIAVGRSPEEARDFLAQVVTKLIRDHEQIYQGAIGPMQQQLVAVDGQVGLLTTQVTELGRLVDRVKESNPVQASLAWIERGRLYTELNQLARDRSVLKQHISKPHSYNSDVVARPALLITPIAPQGAIAIPIGIALGLVVGLLVIWFRELSAKIKAATPSNSG